MLSWWEGGGVLGCEWWWWDPAFRWGRNPPGALGGTSRAEMRHPGSVCRFPSAGSALGKGDCNRKTSRVHTYSGGLGSEKPPKVSILTLLSIKAWVKGTQCICEYLPPLHTPLDTDFCIPFISLARSTDLFTLSYLGFVMFLFCGTAWQ